MTDDRGKGMESLSDQLDEAAESVELPMFLHRDLHELADKVRAMEAKYAELKNLTDSDSLCNVAHNCGRKDAAADCVIERNELKAQLTKK